MNRGQKSRMNNGRSGYWRSSKAMRGTLGQKSAWIVAHLLTWSTAVPRRTPHFAQQPLLEPALFGHDLLLRAGDVAVGHKSGLRRELKSDSSIVTQADRDVEQLITEELEAPDEGRFIVGEETVDQKGEEYIERADERLTGG